MLWKTPRKQEQTRGPGRPCRPSLPRWIHYIINNNACLSFRTSPLLMCQDHAVISKAIKMRSFHWHFQDVHEALFWTFSLVLLLRFLCWWDWGVSLLPAVLRVSGTTPSETWLNWAQWSSRWCGGRGLSGLHPVILRSESGIDFTRSFFPEHGKAVMVKTRSISTAHLYFPSLCYCC